jgi:hypothetical protein
MARWQASAIFPNPFAAEAKGEEDYRQKDRKLKWFRIGKSTSLPLWLPDQHLPRLASRLAS